MTHTWVRWAAAPIRRARGANSSGCRLFSGSLSTRSGGVHTQLTAWEGIVDRGTEAAPITDFLDRPHRGRQITAVVGQGHTAGGNAGMARRSIAIGAQVVVEAPAEDLLTQRRRNRLMLRIGIAGEAAGALGQQGSGVKAAPGPDPFILHLGIKGEGTAIEGGDSPPRLHTTTDRRRNPAAGAPDHASGRPGSVVRRAAWLH